jgi:glutamine synthetase
MDVREATTRPGPPVDGVATAPRSLPENSRIGRAIQTFTTAEPAWQAACGATPKVALEADHDFLLAGDVFTSDLIDACLEHERSEVDAVRLRPEPW